jgi:predicted Zn-dependent protease
VILTEAGETEEALRLAARASELAPDEAAATDTLGWAMFRAGDPAGREVLARAVEQDPKGAIYRLHLARAAAAAGDVEAARSGAEAALALDPEGPESAEIRAFLDGL